MGTIEILLECFLVANRWYGELLSLELVLYLGQAALEVDVHASDCRRFVLSILLLSDHCMPLPFGLVQRGSLPFCSSLVS